MRLGFPLSPPRALYMDPALGLPHQVAQVRLALNGPNILNTPPLAPLPSLAQPCEVSMVAERKVRLFMPTPMPRSVTQLLALVLALLFAFLSGPLLFAPVLLLLLLRVALGVGAAWRAGRAEAALPTACPHEAVVKRAGKLMVMDRRDLVPGDLLLLTPGMVGGRHLSRQQTGSTTAMT